MDDSISGGGRTARGNGNGDLVKTIPSAATILTVYILIVLPATIAAVVVLVGRRRIDPAQMPQRLTLSVLCLLAREAMLAVARDYRD